jgi:hypothetical protein
MVQERDNKIAILEQTIRLLNNKIMEAESIGRAFLAATFVVVALVASIYVWDAWL